MEPITDADLSVAYGEIRFMLNPVLVRRQGIGLAEIAALRKTHITRLKLFEQMAVAEPDLLLDLARQFDDLEYLQQELWRFSRDPCFHRWFDVPRCSCAKEMAEVAYGRTGLRMIHQECPVHRTVIDWTRHEPNTVEVLIKHTDAQIGIGRHRIVDIRDPQMESVLHFTPVRPGFH